MNIRWVMYSAALAWMAAGTTNAEARREVDARHEPPAVAAPTSPVTANDLHQADKLESIVNQNEETTNETLSAIVSKSLGINNQMLAGSDTKPPSAVTAPKPLQEYDPIQLQMADYAKATMDYVAKLAGSTDRLAGYALVLVIVGIFQLAVVAVQLWFLRDTLKAAKISADAARLAADAASHSVATAKTIRSEDKTYEAHG